MKIAKLFRTGGSMAVRLPKAWVRDASEVVMERTGDAIIIRPRKRTLQDLARECQNLDGRFPDPLPQTRSGARVDLRS
ncbi:MAG: AbrB/MazE/SpoVT family DNA-binding domain-containing protein [Puniceicoccaceae bacterium]|nr:MAG: AbrB/MazE/SpoVT family DNA-binding domain-containing protein [Puniceicoccaceae bacterium]